MKQKTKSTKSWSWRQSPEVRTLNRLYDSLVELEEQAWRPWTVIPMARSADQDNPHLKLADAHVDHAFETIVSTLHYVRAIRDAAVRKEKELRDAEQANAVKAEEDAKV